MLFPPDRITLVGILNLTPDSFSDGGRFVGEGGRVDVAAAVAEGRRLAAAGADVLDVGGESTRPGARAVPTAVELSRVIPVLEALASEVGCPLSVDTRKAAVAEAALAAGASIVNDVSAGTFDPKILGVVAARGAGLVLCHSRGTPETMQRNPRYADVLREVSLELRHAVELATRAGVARERIAVDPGIGFGKRLEDNLRLLAGVGRLRRELGCPVLVGPSRKSFLGALTGAPPVARDRATAAACAVAVYEGADAVRVHDVGGARTAVEVARALRGAREAGG